MKYEILSDIIETLVFNNTTGPQHAVDGVTCQFFVSSLKVHLKSQLTLTHMVCLTKKRDKQIYYSVILTMRFFLAVDGDDEHPDYEELQFFYRQTYLPFLFRCQYIAELAYINYCPIKNCITITEVSTTVLGTVLLSL